jgi:hypothetical protein
MGSRLRRFRRQNRNKALRRATEGIPGIPWLLDETGVPAARNAGGDCILTLAAACFASRWVVDALGDLPIYEALLERDPGAARRKP